MKPRTILSLLALLALTAFAPAPFPRPRRGPGPDVDLARFQGLWKVVSFGTVGPKGLSNDPSWGNTQVRVENDRWTFLEAGQFNTAYRIRIDPRQKPAALDFFLVDDRGNKPVMIGLIRRNQGRIEILYTSMANQPRPKTLDQPPRGWWVMTMRPD
jgi:uncharacterized protein (TIGR03067 family)